MLFVEDDERLGQLTTRYLEASGFQVTLVTDGPQALAESRRRTFDAVLLDLMLPGKDGIEVCKELRTRLDVPILMVTARREEADRVLGLDAGADDYVMKPFSSRELVSRVKAVVRRARGQLGPAKQVLTVGEVTIDPAAMRVEVAGRQVLVTSLEFNILRVLAERAGRVLSREQLLDLAARGTTESFERSIDIHISRLRQKLGDDARQPRYLKTVRGVGYLFAGGEP